MQVECFDAYHHKSFVVVHRRMHVPESASVICDESTSTAKIRDQEAGAVAL